MKASGLRRISFLIAFGILAGVGPNAFAQSADAQASRSSQEYQGGRVATPIPKTLSAGEIKSQRTQSESPLVRIAIIGVGSLPFTIFYCDFVFDSIAYVSNGFNSAYAPWPFRSQYSSTISDEERFIRLGVSAALSVCVGILGTLLK